jgi:CubicO group peptidase (beta-lactamase class C family)
MYSTTKTLAALTVLVLVDRGVLDLDAPLVRYWPEFGAHGKHRVRLRHVLSHSAGLPDFDEALTAEALVDDEGCARRLAAQPLAWEPGTRPGYHSLSQGTLLGEVVRRATGRTLGTIFREALGEPLGLDFHFSLPASEDPRVAELVPPTDPVPFTGRSGAALDVGLTRTRAWRAAEIPAAGGIGTARAVAVGLAVLANGGELHGRRFLTAETCRRALATEVEGVDAVLGGPAAYGLGFGLPAMFPFLPQGAGYWGGYGGSLAVVNPGAAATFAYVPSRLVADPRSDLRGIELALAFWDTLAA